MIWNSSLLCIIKAKEPIINKILIYIGAAAYTVSDNTYVKIL